MTATARKKPAKVTLNKATIAVLAVPRDGRIYYHDARTPGLTVCVTSTGARTFYLYRWHNGRPQRAAARHDRGADRRASPHEGQDAHRGDRAGGRYRRAEARRPARS